jgi:hypothetical protein
MYILTCRGGYPIPLTPGTERRIEIVGVRATVNDTTADSRLTLIDDYGQVRTDVGTDITLCDIKGLADMDANLEVLFPEPLKTRKGIAATAVTNLIQGSILVYVR